MSGRPMPAPDVVVEDVDDDICLYRADIDEVVVLNQSAGDVWRLADGELTVNEIAERLAIVYRHSVTKLRPDVDSVVGELLHRGYLVLPDNFDSV